MGNVKVGVIAECVCDLPAEYIEANDIDIVYFLVTTDSGVFTDTAEITAENIIGYLEEGGTKSKSSAPSSEVYIEAFRKKLRKYDEIVLPTISSKVSDSYRFATEAAEKMGDAGKHIHIIDTGHLSTGLGHMVICAAELAKNGKSAEEITAALNDMKGRVSTSFITKNVDYLCRNGLVSKTVKKLCDTFNAHPVLAMKNGGMALQSMEFGNYEKACLRYVKKQLKKESCIDKTRAFITHAMLPAKNLEMIKNQVEKRCGFNEIIVTAASATVTSNCGPGSVGVLFVKNSTEE